MTGPVTNGDRRFKCTCIGWVSVRYRDESNDDTTSVVGCIDGDVYV